MPAILTAGREFQININSGGNNGISGAQDLPDAALLTDGRFAVTYQSEYFGSVTDNDPIVAIFDASGTTSLAYRDAFNFGAQQKAPAGAGRLDGGLGVVFQNDRHANGTTDANGPNITYVPVTAAGALLTPLAVADFNAGAGHDALRNPAIATLSSGRQVVVFERVWTLDIDHDVFLNVVNEAGNATQFSASNPSSVASNGDWQANPAVAAIGNQALVVFEDATGTTTASANIRARIFNGDTNALGTAFTIADHAGRLRTADVAAIDDHRYVIVYGDQNDVWAKVLDAGTGILSAEIQLDVEDGFSLNPQVSGAPGGRFVATWAQWNGADYDAYARLYDSDANPVGAAFIVTTLTDNSQFTPTVTASADRIFFAWSDFAARPEDAAAPGIRGRIVWLGQFDQVALPLASFGSSADAGGWSSNNQYPRTVGDVNGDGRSDIIGFGDAATYVALGNADGTFQNTILAINSFGFSPAAGGFTSNNLYPRTVGDVNGDGRADIVGFGDAGVFVSLGNANGTFQNPIVGINSFGFSPAGGGWTSNDQYPRTLADVNGDGRADIIGFGDTGTYVALGNAGGTFQSPIFGIDAFGASLAGGAWTSNNQYPRTVGDVNGDGRADIVGFSDAGVYVAHGNADGTFQAPFLDLASFGASAAVGGWSSNDLFPRALGDINGDGADDILGFGSAGVFTSFGGDILVA